MGIGEGKYKIRAKFVNLPTNKIMDFASIKTTIYLDDRWDNVLEATTCIEKKSLSHVEQILNIPANGEFGEYVTGSLVQSQKRHVWFFSISDCRSKLESWG